MQVIWSKKADITFGVIVDYIEAKFGKKSTLKFIFGYVYHYLVESQSQDLTFTKFPKTFCHKSPCQFKNKRLFGSSQVISNHLTLT